MRPYDAVHNVLGVQRSEAALGDFFPRLFFSRYILNSSLKVSVHDPGEEKHVSADE